MIPSSENRQSEEIEPLFPKEKYLIDKMDDLITVGNEE